MNDEGVLTRKKYQGYRSQLSPKDRRLLGTILVQTRRKDGVDFLSYLFKNGLPLSLVLFLSVIILSNIFEIGTLTITIYLLTGIFAIVVTIVMSHEKILRSRADRDIAWKVFLNQRNFEYLNQQLIYEPAYISGIDLEEKIRAYFLGNYD